MKSKIILFLLVIMQIALFGQNLHSWDGKGISPNSKFRALSVFINVIYDVNPNYYDSVKPSQYWGQASVEGVNNEAIPTYLLDFVDTAYNSSNLHATMTRLYGESSFDSLQIIGDFVVVNVKESRVLNTYNSFNCSTIGNTAINIINQNGLQTLYHHDSIDDYDFLNNNTIFFAQFLIRNITHQYGGLSSGEGYGYHYTDSSIRIGNNFYSISHGSMQGCGSINISYYTSHVVYHEFSHSLFGSNDFHTSGGNHRGRGGFMPFFTLQEGYGLMGQANKSLMSCNGYERWRMHWKHPNAPDYITARNNTDAKYLNSDICKEDGNKTFLLRDFVTYGDVVRIKLPYKDSENASNQYIWLENHKVGYNNKWDFFQYSNTANCRPQGNAGIYAYYQVGRDILSGTFSDVWFSNERDNLKIIPAEGYWDYNIHTDSNNPYNLQCVNWENHTYYHSRESANPFCGYQDQEVQIHPDTTDIIINLSQEYGMWRKIIGNNKIDSLAALGDNRDAFSVYSKINMGTNPSTCNTKTYYNNMDIYGLANFTSQSNRNNQTTYLTGLSIEMIPQANNDFMVHIRWDNYDIVNDPIWTGLICLKEKANLISGHQIMLTQNLTLAQPYRDTKSGEFSPTTVFTCDDKSEFTLQSQSSVNLEQKSKISLKTGSIFTISDGADVFVGSGCVFEIEPCAKLIIQSSGALHIDDSAIFIVHSGAILQIDEINNIRLPINSNFSTGDGLTFSSVEELFEGLGIPTDFSISGTVIWTGLNKILTHELIIESGATLTINNTVNCLKDVIIAIKPGGKLIIDGGTITNACDGEMWQGIFVEGNPNDLTQSENLQGVVELKNGATIQNAVCAINVGRELLGSAPMMCDLGGGIVRAQNASFINNLQAIEFGAYDRDLVVGNTHQRNNASEISLCTFTINNNALFDLNEFEEHVKLIEVRGVRFSGCTFESEDFKGSAIRSLSSGFRLADYNWGFLYGYGIRSSVNYFNTAIYIQDGGTKSNVIYNTDFNNNNTSILGEGLSELYIEGNSFNIPYSPYYGPTLGVSLIKCSNFRITNNYFTGHNECDYGLIITHSDENNNIVRNNEFSGLNKACVAYGKNSDGQDGVKGLQYHCNLFDNNTNDIYVADFDSEIGSIRFVQGDNGEACGNIFGEYRISLFSESYNFQYFYNNNLPRHNPFNISSNIRTLPKNTDLCSQIGVINPNIVSAEIPINWYYDLSCEYDLVSSSLNNAKSVYHNHGYDMISIDWEFYFNTVEIPWELEEQVNLYYEIIDLQSQVSEICKLAMYYIHSDSVFDFDVYHDWLTRTHTPEADYLLAESYYEAENYTECFNVLNAIPSNYQFYDEIEYQNYSVFYSIKEYLRTNNIGWESLTGSPEKAILDAIALSGINGGAIKARAIEVAYFGVIIDPFLDPIRLMDLCIYISNTNMEENDSLKKNGLSITEEKSEKNNLSIFPNPAFDKLTVNYENLKIKEISIYDIVGKEVGRYTIDNTKTVLNITHLRPSIYFIQIETENGTVTKRFVKE